MARRICHILESSGREGMGIARIVASLHKHIGAEYQATACFVGNDGPLVKEFDGLGIPTIVISWKHPSRDIAGALGLAGYLQREDFDLLHFHWGGAMLRRLAQLVSTSKIVLHIHSPIDEVDVTEDRNISTAACDGV